MSADGNTALIGAYGDDDRGAASGSVYIYKWRDDLASWSKLVKLVPPDGAASDYFGYSVALSEDGNAALMGAYGDDDKGSGSGSAYLYKWDSEYSQWAYKKFVAKDGAASDYFGRSVSLSADGNTALIGAYGDDDKGSASGSVYVFKLGSGLWEQVKIVAKDGAASDYYGLSVALSADGNTALIGAHLDDDKGADSGAAYCYHWNGTSWEDQKLIAAEDGAAGDRFGLGVALSADSKTALIGAYLDDETYADVGSTYFFKN